MQLRLSGTFSSLPRPLPQEGEGRESGHQRLHNPCCFQPAGDSRCGKDTADQGAADASGEGILAGQVEVANRGSRAQPAGLEPLWSMVEAVNFPVLVAAEIPGRKGRGQLMEVYMGPGLGEVAVQVRQQPFRPLGLECLIVRTPLAPGLVLPLGEPLIRGRGDNLDGRFPGVPVGPVRILAGGKGNIDQGQLRLGIYFLSRSEEHTSELQSRPHLVCRLLLEKKKIYAASYLFFDPEWIPIVCRISHNGRDVYWGAPLPVRSKPTGTPILLLRPSSQKSYATSS